MSLTVAAAGSAVAWYLLSRRGGAFCGAGNGRGGASTHEGGELVEAHYRGAYRAPSTFLEDLYFFAEGLR